MWYFKCNPHFPLQTHVIESTLVVGDMNRIHSQYSTYSETSLEKIECESPLLTLATAIDPPAADGISSVENSGEKY